MKCLKKNWLIITIFACFFVYLFFQHLQVFLYHDDYGYLSLSYEVNVPVSGLHYGLADIFQFLGMHYQSWGGRIVGFFFEIFLGHLGLSVYHFFQSLMILGIFIFIYLIATKTTKLRNSTMALFTVLCYGLFEIMQLRSGIYWITASCLYIVPLCFFLAFVYLHLIRKEITFSKTFYRFLYDFLLLVLVFLGTYSQEQIAIAVLGYVLIVTIVQYSQTKKADRGNVLFCLVSLIAFAILMLAPGNNVRLTHRTSAAFYALSFFEKFRLNVPAIVTGILGNYTRYFTGIFFLILLYCAYDNLKKKKGVSLFNDCALLLSILMILGQLMFAQSYFGYVYDFFGDHLFLLSLVFIGHFFVIGYIVILYLVNHKEWNVLYLVISAILSQGVMLVAPYYALRSGIIFNIICFIFFINVLCHVKVKFKCNLLYLLLPFLLLTSLNMISVYQGYQKNCEVNKENDRVLKEVSQNIQAGMQYDHVVLHMVPDILYSGDQPYTEGNAYIIDWIREYYDIPKDVVISYE